VEEGEDQVQKPANARNPQDTGVDVGQHPYEVLVRGIQQRLEGPWKKGTAN
jgi:hypothetical protein